MLHIIPSVASANSAVYRQHFNCNMLCYWCSVDATLTKCLAKYVNHGVKEQENCIVRKTIINKNVYLALYAKRVIYEGEELRYDYGLQSRSWRQKQTKRNARRHTELNSASEANSAVNNTSVQTAAAAGEGSAVLMATESQTAASVPLLSHGASEEFHSLQSTEKPPGGAGEGSAVLMTAESSTAASVPLQPHGAAKESHSVQPTEKLSDIAGEGPAVVITAEFLTVDSVPLLPGGTDSETVVEMVAKTRPVASVPMHYHSTDDVAVAPKFCLSEAMSYENGQILITSTDSVAHSHVFDSVKVIDAYQLSDNVTVSPSRIDDVIASSDVDESSSSTIISNGYLDRLSMLRGDGECMPQVNAKIVQQPVVQQFTQNVGASMHVLQKEISKKQTHLNTEHLQSRCKTMHGGREKNQHSRHEVQKASPNAISHIRTAVKMGQNNASKSTPSEIETFSESVVGPSSCQMQQDNDDATTSSDSGSENNITVLQTNNLGGKRRYDKKAYCFFCGTKQSHIVRHWCTQHKDELKIQQLMVSKGDHRRKVIATLRNMGNHTHNANVLATGKGEVLVAYRPGDKVNAKKYVPCDGCYAYLNKRDLYRHRCPVKGRSKGRVAERAALLLPAPNNLSPAVHRVINGMQDGEIKTIASADAVIGKLAAKLVEKHSYERRNYIRAKVREICRLLLEMRRITNKPNLAVADCIDPSYFTQVIQAVKNVTGYNTSSGAYDKPSTALKLGHTLKKAAQIVKTEAIINRHDETIGAADRFFDLCEYEWQDEISGSAERTLTDRKRNSVNLLPISEDVKKLHMFLRQQIEHWSDLFARAVSPDQFEVAYRYLAESTLAQIICFNRRRAGEVSRMTLSDFSHRTSSDLEGDVQQGLGKLEQSLCRLFVRVEIRGKRGRTVPVLLTKQTESALVSLMENRDRSGVKSENKYMFALSYSDNYLRGCDCLRNASQKCDATHPERLRSTKLRKHVATLCQVLNMKKHELDVLAQFMGHDIAVHRKYYRLPSETMQMANIAKIFLLMENGSLAQEHGKSLCDLPVDSNAGNA